MFPDKSPSLAKSFIYSFVIILLIGCQQRNGEVTSKDNNKVSVAIGERVIALDSYQIKFGSVSENKVEEGLSKVLDNLKASYQSQIENDEDLFLEGYILYTLRLEPDGRVRMLMDSGAEFTQASGSHARDSFSTYLMTHPIDFPELTEIAMIEAKFTFH